MTQRPGEKAASDVAVTTMRHDPGAWYDALPRAVAAAYPLIAAAVLADVRVQLEQSGQLQAAAFVGRMEQERSNA